MKTSKQGCQKEILSRFKNTRQIDEYFLKKETHLTKTRSSQITERSVNHHNFKGDNRYVYFLLSSKLKQGLL